MDKPNPLSGTIDLAVGFTYKTIIACSHTALEDFIEHGLKNCELEDVITSLFGLPEKRGLYRLEVMEEWCPAYGAGLADGNWKLVVKAAKAIAYGAV